MAKVKDGKAIQICASSFIPHLASDILKNECLLPLLSSRGNNIKFEGFELRFGYTFFGLLPLPLSSINGGKKKPFVSTLRRINREEARQLQQRERYPSQEGDKRGNLHAREHFRPSVRPSEFLGLDWQLGRGALSISSSPFSSCSHLAFVTGGLPARRLQSPNAAKCVVFGSIVEREGGRL